MHRLKIRVFFSLAFLLVLIFILSGCSRKISDNEALEIINRKLELSISSDSLNVVYTNYNTNFRDYGFLIVADIECQDISEIVHSLQLNPTNLSELVEEGTPNEITHILGEYVDFDTSLYCRYEYGRLLNGEIHTASVYLICLSEKGRLILYEDI